MSHQISDVAPAVGQEAPTRGFYTIIPDSRDTGRVVLGASCGGVKANNNDKVRD